MAITSTPISNKFNLLPLILTQVVIPTGVDEKDLQICNKIVIESIFLVKVEVKELFDSSMASFFSHAGTNSNCTFKAAQ